MTAAATRKLQKDIETVLKKVDDGLEEFAEYWEQASGAGGKEQRDRLGEELKKTINKLQRFRIQIREWIAQSFVHQSFKDKLEQSRKLIEIDMQRFKDFERDLKTKAFSTNGLSRGDDLEMEAAEKLKYQDWLAQMIQSLNDQLDCFEADLELLSNKKALDGEEKARLPVLKALQERHRWHIRKLELLLRAVDNDAANLGDVAVIRDSIEFYVENHEDESCYHDEGIYDCFDLVEYEERPALARTPEANEEPSKKVSKEKDKKKKEDKKDKKKDEKKNSNHTGFTRWRRHAEDHSRHGQGIDIGCQDHSDRLCCGRL